MDGPLYNAGTKLLGKREANAYCRPLTPERVSSLFSSFPEASVIHHGAVLRYPLLALSKLGIQGSLDIVWKLIAFDDALCSKVPGLRETCSSVALIARRS